MIRPVGIGPAFACVALPREAVRPAAVQDASRCAVDRLEDARPAAAPRAAGPSLGPVAPVAEPVAGSGTFNPSLLRVALAADPMGPGHQAVVRDQLRLLLGKYGAVDRDTAAGLPRAADFKVSQLLPFNGAHLDNGLIQVSPKTHAEALRFLNGARDRNAIKGIGSLIHEGLHGHSPAGDNIYYLDAASKGIDHLLVATAAQAIVVREFGVRPESVTTDIPYGVNETIDVIARSAGLKRDAARNVMYDAALQYFGPGSELRDGQDVEQRAIDVVSNIVGTGVEGPLRRQLRNLPV